MNDRENVVALPYGGRGDPNSGFAKGSPTSEARARSDDASGRTAHRQTLVFRYLNERGARGVTWKELAQAMTMHHGQASGALSNLHKAGQIARLAESRDRCRVYVLTEHVNERPTEPHGSNKAVDTSLLDGLAAIVDLLLPDQCDTINLPFHPKEGCLTCTGVVLLKRYRGEE